MKRVYFVRHGETQGNVDRTDYGPQMELTEAGELQALQIAERSKGIDFDVLITSDLHRAKETAEVIRSVKKCTVEVSPLFTEYTPPTILNGVRYDDPAFRTYVKERDENFDNSDWRFDDAENIVELSARVEKARIFLESREEEAIMVVTHSFFLRFFTASLLFGKSLTADAWAVIGRSLLTTNTGVTVYVYENNTWKLLTWNDHAHFAE